MNQKEFDPRRNRHLAENRMDTRAFKLAGREVLDRVDEFAPQTLHLFQKGIGGQGHPWARFRIVLGAIARQVGPIFREHAPQSFEKYFVVAGKVCEIFVR